MHGACFRLFADSIVKILFATETFAMGVNMPARSGAITLTTTLAWVTGKSTLRQLCSMVFASMMDGISEIYCPESICKHLLIYGTTHLYYI